MDLKSVKEFFKPTRTKILIFIAVLSITAISFIIQYIYSFIQYEIYRIIFDILIMLVIFIETPAIILIYYFYYTGFPEIFIILSLSSLIVWPYIFSCIFVYIYEKPNKTKRIKEFLKPTINKIIFFSIFLIFFWIIPFPYGTAQLFGFYSPIIAYILSCLIADNPKRNITIVIIVLLSIYFFIPGYISAVFKPYVYTSSRFELEIREFVENCKDYCTENSSLRYCTEYFGKDIPVSRVDWNENGIENELIKIGGDIKYNVCEDRIYCFHIIPCERFGENPIEGCANQLCQVGHIKYGNKSLDSRFIFDDWKITPTQDIECNISINSIPDEFNWYKINFPENVCEKYINETE